MSRSETGAELDPLRQDDVRGHGGGGGGDDEPSWAQAYAAEELASVCHGASCVSGCQPTRVVVEVALDQLA